MGDAQDLYNYAVRKTGIADPIEAQGSRKLVYQGYSVLYRIAEERIEILTI
jgi:hypothetical protein